VALSLQHAEVAGTDGAGFVQLESLSVRGKLFENYREGRVFGYGVAALAHKAHYKAGLANERI